MDSIESMIKAKLSEAVLGQIADKAGIDASKAGGIVDMALPMILGKMGRNAEDKSSAESLQKALSEDHDGSIMDQLQGMIGDQKVEEDGGKILGHVFGDNLGGVTQMLSGSTGADSGVVGMIMKYLAPMVMGQLGKANKEQNLDLDGLTAMLGKEKESTDNELGGIAKMLDRDNDGSVMDDLIELGKGFLK